MKLGRYVAGAALLAALASPVLAEEPVRINEVTPLNLGAALANEGKITKRRIMDGRAFRPVD